MYTSEIRARNINRASRWTHQLPDDLTCTVWYHPASETVHIVEDYNEDEISLEYDANRSWVKLMEDVANVPPAAIAARITLYWELRKQWIEGLI